MTKKLEFYRYWYIFRIWCNSNYYLIFQREKKFIRFVTVYGPNYRIWLLGGTKDSALFPGTNQYKRFSKFLEKLCIKHKDEIMKDFGVDIEDIGVHSIRKGAASYVSPDHTSPSQGHGPLPLHHIGSDFTITRSRVSALAELWIAPHCHNIKGLWPSPRICS